MIHEKHKDVNITKKPSSFYILKSYKAKLFYFSLFGLEIDQEVLRIGDVGFRKLLDEGPFDVLLPNMKNNENGF